MIHPTGLYVLESKNYSGWIFGSDSSKYWTQTLPQGKKCVKEKFLNPVIQNRTHIKYLKKLVAENYSCNNIVVFSDRCTFKNVTIDLSADYKVIQRKDLKQTIAEMTEKASVISAEQIEYIYNILYPYSQVTEETKRKHIQKIKELEDHTNPI